MIIAKLALELCRDEKLPDIQELPTRFTDLIPYIPNPPQSETIQKEFPPHKNLKGGPCVDSFRVATAVARQSVRSPLSTGVRQASEASEQELVGLGFRLSGC